MSPQGIFAFGCGRLARLQSSCKQVSRLHPNRANQIEFAINLNINFKFSTTKMKEKISSNAVALDVAAGKKQYVKPQIEVIDLDEQPKLLSASNFGAGFSGVNRGSWDDEE
jgi:hypothetical protein